MIGWLLKTLLRWSIRLAILLWPITLVIGAILYLRYLA